MLLQGGSPSFRPGKEKIAYFFSYFALYLLPVLINRNNKGIYEKKKPPAFIWCIWKVIFVIYSRDIKVKKVDEKQDPRKPINRPHVPNSVHPLFLDLRTSKDGSNSQRLYILTRRTSLCMLKALIRKLNLTKMGKLQNTNCILRLSVLFMSIAWSHHAHLCPKTPFSPNFKNF